MDVSVCSICWNEEEMLPLWFAQLKNIPQVKQVILVDTGSTDRSIEIARANGATVIESEFTGFADARNKAQSLAECEWLGVQWDIDEVFTKNFAQYLSQHEAYGKDAYRIPEFDGLFDKRHSATNLSPGPSSRYLIKRGVSCWYSGAFPEEFHCSSPLYKIGPDPMGLGGTMNGFMHGRYLKVILRALRRNTSIVTEEGMTRLRYFVNRTFTWQEDGIPVGPEYIKQAFEECEHGDFSKANYIGAKEVQNLMITPRRFDMLKLEDLVDPAILPLISDLPERTWQPGEFCLEFMKKPAREIYGLGK